MTLLFLLLVPVLLGLGGLIFSKGRVTWKEFLVHEGAVVLIIAMGYLFGTCARTSDKEIWNGVIAKKWKDTSSCCHSYPCNCREECSGSGNDRSCHTVCDTCYEHSYDVEWEATTSNGEHVFHDGCNPPGSGPPSRWVRIVIGEPTAVEHRYTNYIKGNPGSILRRSGAAERFAGKLPEYPRVYDHYRADRLITVGVNLPDGARLNRRLSEINARLGAPKQVNIILLVAAETDQSYIEGLRESWLGGKKNDLIVVIGLDKTEASSGPPIAWAGVVSWTRNEDIKVSIRNRVLDLKSFDGDKVLDIVAEEVEGRFVRRPMADFEYLKATIEPPRWAVWTLFGLGLFIAVGLQIFFWIHDPFGGDRERSRFTFSLRGIFGGRRRGPRRP